MTGGSDLDPETRLSQPIQIGNRYPGPRPKPLMTAKHLLEFAHREAEKNDEHAHVWQRVYEALLTADTVGDLDFAVALFKAAADQRRWLSR
jgi:hypothetical protein